MADRALPIRGAPELALGGRLLSDERLARLVSRGSTRAFASLYQRHHQALYRYCHSIVRDEDDAQDALQNAMMRALAALRSGERDLAVRAWLFRIVHNEAVSILRKRRPEVSLAEELEPAGPAVEQTAENRERLAALVADLQALAERQRAALLMRELSGLSIEEIAAALCTSPGAAKQALFEARRALHDFAQGRAMECEQVRRVISDGDRRMLRGRKIRGHLRECEDCRDFQAAISTRGADLRALAPPLSLAATGGMLGKVLAHGASGGHASGALAASEATVGHTVSMSLALKALAGVALVGTAALGTAHLAFGPKRNAPGLSAARQSVAPQRTVPVREGAGAPASHNAIASAALLPAKRKTTSTESATESARVLHTTPRGAQTTAPAASAPSDSVYSSPAGSEASLVHGAGAAGHGSSKRARGAPSESAGRHRGSSQSVRGTHGAHRRASAHSPNSLHAHNHTPSTGELNRNQQSHPASKEHATAHTPAPGAPARAQAISGGEARTSSAAKLPKIG